MMKNRNSPLLIVVGPSRGGYRKTGLQKLSNSPLLIGVGPSSNEFLETNTMPDTVTVPF